MTSCNSCPPGALRGFGRRIIASSTLFVAVVSLAVAWPLQNDQMVIEVEPRGGIVSEMRMLESPEDDRWLSEGDAARANDLYGHFLCFDRWGPVTPEEAADGHQFHGEAARVMWSPVVEEPPLGLVLETTLPVSGLRATRGYHLPSGSGGIQITTTVNNPGYEVRPYNLVEHITLADAWSHPDVRLHTNARTGLVHANGRLVPDAEVNWPAMKLAKARWDLRGEVRQRGRLVVSLVFSEHEEWGWVCLQDPHRNRLLAYVWRTADFPWLNLYWHADDDHVLRRAIEPGTTGLHRPMSELLVASPWLGRPVVHHLAPGAERQRGLWGFAAHTPADAGEIVALERTEMGWVARSDKEWRLSLESIN